MKISAKLSISFRFVISFLFICPIIFPGSALSGKGGSDESNLSAYLAGAGEQQRNICLDAGTVHAGMKKQ